jgi:hypothetical protein
MCSVSAVAQAAGRNGRAGADQLATLHGRIGRGTAACLQISFLSCAVNQLLGLARASSQRVRSLGKVRSTAHFPPPNHIEPPPGSLVWQGNGVARHPTPSVGTLALEDQDTRDG